MANWFQDLAGTSVGSFFVGLTGVKLKNNSGTALQVRNNADSEDAALQTSQLLNSGNSIIINSSSASSGTDWPITIARPTTGMAAATTLTLPSGAGTPNQVLQTDGSGNLSWASAASTSACEKDKSVALAFGSTSPVAIFTTGTGDIIDSIDLIVDTLFNGSPTVSIGVSGTTSKYMATSQANLTAAATTKFTVNPSLPAQGAEALIITYVAGGATAGAARVIVHYATPA